MTPIYHLIGLVVLVPIGLLLTVSFFILVVLHKIDSEALRAFGRVIVVILWIAAFLFAVLGTYEIVTGDHPVMHFLKESMLPNQ